MEARQIMKFRNHHFILIGMISVSGFVGAQMGLYLLHTLYGYHFTWSFLWNCLVVIKDLPLIHAVISNSFNILIIYSFGMVLIVGFKQLLLQIKWNRYVKVKRLHELSNIWNEKFNHIVHEIVVIEHNGMLALTTGFLRPRIIISKTLLAGFSEEEITAIVLHENCHCRNYDPLRMLIVKVISDGLPFIPILRQFSHYINVWVELEADHYVVHTMKSPVDLSNVLLKFSKMCSKSEVGIAFADKAINYRLQRLIEPKKKIHVPIFKFTPLVISLFVIFFIGCMVISGCI